MKRIIATLLFIASISGLTVQAKTYTVNSPNGNIKVTVVTDKQLNWCVDFMGERVLNPSRIAMNVDGMPNQLGTNVKVIKSNITRVDEEQIAIIPTKQRKIRDLYNQLTIKCKGGYSVLFRVYNNGAAYRFVTQLKSSNIYINSETVEQNWENGSTVYWPREKNQEFITHCEAIFDKKEMSELDTTMKGYLPIYLTTTKGTKVVIMESDLTDYPNMFLTGNHNNTLSGEFPPVVLKSELKPGADRDEKMVEKAHYIAKTTGNRVFPWRLLMINKDDKGVLENNLAYQLASPSASKETNWIKPGKISWDWWSTLNVYGVDFKAGVNTDTYKYFIDFAAKYHIEYVLLDEGWSAGTWNIKEPIHGLDIHELVEYGKAKNVGLVLWTLWNPLNKDLEGILDLYQKWGIKGIKVDFMQRSDQYMVNFYERVGKAAMERKLLVDFHGAFKPSGLQKKYPNVMTFEGVLGMEHDKDSRDINPVHDLILPFTRMAAGPMDYTPGAVGNATAADFYINFVHPISLGTRAHQVALYVVYESPLQMMADSPSSYYKEPDYTSFISRIPTTWDDTKAISAKIGEQLLIARRKDRIWYIAGLTDWNRRTLDLKLDFLDSGKYKVEIFKDGINADVYASDYKIEKLTVTKNDHMKVTMAKGGGWTAILTPID